MTRILEKIKLDAYGHKSESQKMKFILDQIKDHAVNLRGPNHTNVTNLITQLRQLHPNYFQAIPGGRSEVVLLSKWLEESLQKIKTDPQLESRLKVQQADDILSLVFAELSRQVSYHCQERGELLMQVFTSYFNLQKRIIEIFNADCQKFQFDEYLKRKDLNDKLQRELSYQIDLAIEYRDKMLLSE